MTGMVVFLAACSVLSALFLVFMLSVIGRPRELADWCMAAIAVILCGGLGVTTTFGAVQTYRRDSSGWEEVCDQTGTKHGMIMVGKVFVPTTYQGCVKSHYECKRAQCGEFVQ